MCWLAAGGDCHVQAQKIYLGRAGEVLEARDDSREDSGQQDRQEVGAVGGVCGEVGEHAGYSTGSSLASSGWATYLANWSSCVGDSLFHRS